MAHTSAQPQASDEGSRLSGAVHGAARGAVGAMAMSGMRKMTIALGVLEEAPPHAIAHQRMPGIMTLLRRAPGRKRTILVEGAHWSFGAATGALFGTLPPRVRDRPWAGPVYGLGVWLGFELGIAPALGLSQAKRPRPVDRLALAADHLLFGVVLSGMRPSAHR